MQGMATKGGGSEANGSPRCQVVEVIHASGAGGPRLRQGSDPRIQLAPCRTDLAFLMHTTSRILHAKADRLLVYGQSAVVHVVSEGTSEVVL